MRASESNLGEVC